MVYSSPSNYWIKQGAVTFTLNALDDPDKLAIAVSAGAVIMAYAKVNNQVIIDYNAGHNYRTWALQASPTHFERTDKVYVYARLSKVADTAMLVFPYEKMPIDPGDESDYYYILLGALTSSMNEGSQVYREWDREEGLSFGTLDTDEQWNEQSSEALDRMFKIDSNNVIWTQNNLTFLAGKRLLLLRMSVLGDSTGANTAEITSITKAANINDVTFAGAETSLPTTAAMVHYAALLEQLYNSRFLRKDRDDATTHKLTMKSAEVTEDLSVGGDVELGGDMQSESFTESSDFSGQGWKIDQWGNAVLESAKIRSFLEVVELLINRIQAQEGDTIFTDNDQIEGVTPVIETINNEEIVTSYILDLKEKWDGYFTSQMKGNILKGIINTLAAKEAGVSDESDNNPDKQGSDDGGNKYYTSWMQVVDTHNTSASLAKNQIRVVLYGDDYDDPITGERVHITPAGKNFPPCEMMVIARWGCYQNPNEPGISSAEKASRIKRQQLFYLSTSDGRITKLTGVDSPILQEGNYGTTLGTLPEFVKSWGAISNRLIDGRDYLYAQGVVVGDFIKVDINGLPIVQYVDCGEWIDGGASGVTPEIGAGIYLCNEKNTINLQWETHDAWRFGKKWRCKMHQPVAGAGGVLTYNPPMWGSDYWDCVEGDTTYSIDFVYHGGDTFAKGAVNTTISPHLFSGSEEITDYTKIPLANWSWERSSDKRTADTIAADEAWNALHHGVKDLALTNDDMPIWWDDDNRIIFSVKINLPDGKTLTFEL